MNSIEHLRVLVGLSGPDELRVAHHRPALDGQLRQWQPEYTRWFRASTAWPDDVEPFLGDYFDSFICAAYDEAFFASQYGQALHWLRHGIDGGHTIASLSRIRQFFIGLGETWQDPDLARSLCRVVDVAQSIQAMVYHLSHTLERLRRSAEHDVARIGRSCESIAALQDHAIIQAYTDHFSWKVRAYSLALGDPVDPGEVPLDPHECPLGRWLDRGGLETLHEDRRAGLLSAHERLHSLMAVVLGEARNRRPQQVVQYLMDIEAASEEVGAVLGERIEEEMRKLAALDTLTRLGNRRMFEQELRRRQAHACRNGSGFGLLFMDLDYFKQVNDRYGHQMGDQVLKTAARRMQEGLRGADAVYRWGGEEFAALVHAEGVDELLQAAERIRTFVGETPITAETETIPLTISIGGSYQASGAERAVDELFRLADCNLHQAKRDGRNRSVVG